MGSIFSLTSGFAFLLYLFFGFYIIFLDYKSHLNRNFFYYSFLLALWALGHSLASFTASPAYKILYQRCYYIAGSFFPVFFLRFILILSRYYENKVIKILVNTFVWIFPAITSYVSITGNIIAESYPVSWYLYFQLQCFGFNIAGFIALYRWRQRTGINREKQQAIILLIAGIITLAAGNSADFTAGFYHLEPVSSSTHIILFVCLIYVIIKHRFIQFTTTHACEEILGNISESVILLDKQFKIITLNHCCKKVLGMKENMLSGKDVSSIVWEHQEFTAEMDKLFAGITCNFSCRLHFVRSDGTRVMMDIECSIIKDMYNDISGVLIIGREVKELKQIKEQYMITERETEVIQHIICGQSNRKIADFLGIKERTIKSHITNIYHKLGVKNKVQLMILLKDFNLVPEASEKILLRRKE